MMISLRNLRSWVRQAYPEQHVLPVVRDLVARCALRRQQQVVDGDPDLAFHFRQPRHLAFLHLGPLAVFEPLALAFFVAAQPRPLFDEHDAGHEHVVLEVQVAEDCGLHVLGLVRDVADDADGRERDVELDACSLSVELLLARLLGQRMRVGRRVDKLYLAADQSLDVAVAEVDQLEQVVVCRVDGRPVEEHALEEVHQDRLVEELVTPSLPRCSSSRRRARRVSASSAARASLSTHRRRPSRR